MKVFLETSLKDFYLALIHKEKVIDKIYLRDLIKKSDIVSKSLENLLFANNVSLQSIDAFYTTSGPGSFMGIRASLTFFSTIAGVMDKPLYVISTLKLLALLNSEEVFIDAKGGNAYTIIDEKEVIVSSSMETHFNVANFENNVESILLNFEHVSPFEDNSNYLKDPRIG